MNDTSLTLLGGLKKHNPKAWHDFTKGIGPWLGSILFRTGVHRNDVDDVAQSILLSVARGIAKYEWRGPGTFRAWLSTITQNETSAHWRAQTRVPQVGTEEIQDRLNRVEAFVEHEFDDALLGIILARVRKRRPPTEWAAFEGARVDGKPFEQVAAELGITVSAVAVAYRKISRLLRKEAAYLVSDDPSDVVRSLRKA